MSKIGRGVAVKGSDNSEVSVRNDFRFFTPLRSVQNDRIDLLFKSITLCVSNVNTP